MFQPLGQQARIAEMAARGAIEPARIPAEPNVSDSLLANAEAAAELDVPASEFDAHDQLRRRWKDGVILGSMAVVFGLAEKFGVSHHLPWLLGELSQSGKRPVCGYIGGWVIGQNPNSKLNCAVGLFLIGSAADIGAELGQATIEHHQPVLFIQKWGPEHNTADYCAAMFGTALWMARNRSWITTRRNADDRRKISVRATLFGARPDNSKDSASQQSDTA